MKINEANNKIIELKPDHAGAYYNRGVAKISLEDYYGAIRDFNKVLKLKPKSKYNLANILYKRGVALNKEINRLKRHNLKMKISSTE